MNRTLTIVLQVFGYLCLLAMSTTIQIEQIVKFEPPVLVRVTVGLIGISLLLIGAIWMQRIK